MNDPSIEKGKYEAIRTAVSQIANGQSLGKAYMNIGYFVQKKLNPPNEPALSYVKKFLGDTYCGTNARRSDTGPQYFYNKALQHFNKEKSTDEAKALHYFITCEAPSSRCWGVRPSDALPSKELFARLHSKYKGSKWAKQTPYYY